MADYIVHHQQAQPHIGFVQFVQEYWRRIGLGRVPPVTNIQGSVTPYVNEGRWVADCPAGCGGALVVTNDPAIFICPDCGSPENGNNWYAVVFPPDKATIERVLLVRPSRRPDHARTRNWLPWETVADLKRENRARGLAEE